MRVLGIETSCDETSAAVVEDGRDVRSNVIFTQTALHRPYGGVVPEIASRSHVENLPRVVDSAREKAGIGWGEIDAVAVTYGPGLASSLLVGLSFAKALAMRLDRPLCGINHLEAHIYSTFLGADAPRFSDVCPFVSCVISGGHTCLVRVDGLGVYRLLGQTIDDAAGEAFDKGANLLGLGYPGGPAIDKASRDGDPAFVKFPRGRQKKEHVRLPGMDVELCFSYSGLKTSLRQYLEKNPLSSGKQELPALAASYQEAIVDAVVDRCRRALGQGSIRALSCVGGVSLNSRLRAKLKSLADECGVRLLLAGPALCADNAGMVAGLAGTGRGVWGETALGLDVCPNLPVV
jgi:N6-L-threonylcarbamoyladenine synthase